MRTWRARVGRTSALTASVLFVIVAVACGQDGETNPAADRTAPVSASSAPTTTASDAPSSSAPPSTSEQTPTNQRAAGADCTADMLDAQVVAGDAGAGTVHRWLKFTNQGEVSCAFQGFPGVSYVTGGDGRQVGEPAKRVGTKGGPVELAPGASARVDVGFVNVHNFDPAQCEPTDVRGLRIYPPQETNAMFVPLATTGCAGAVPDPQLTVQSAIPA
ncbi:uncharacterized protein DUF4232 [Tamaricihabitans halophyticus]|uniref:Uncharacterized protein DUF4232 n=1 Tax=Tamaricihabitans halophyticus TaxID=1262583 RepID=A0A4R2R527_9PSEU|nr:DUF4232 domain-containing protein [Tamaricihabitans halophyticus]TCP57127.1 uncharacterized protein DUF4232 [Tamaricihabitans halophyticus]